MIKIAYQRSMLIALAISGVVGFDQTTKRIAEITLNGLGVQSFFFDTFRLQFIHNPGVLLGLGSGLSPLARIWLFIVMPIVLLSLGSLYALFSQRLNRVQVLFIALIIGGGIGNLIDRLVQGMVTDFMNMGIGPVRTGIFNIADVAIMFGAIGLLVAEYMRERIKGEALDQSL